MKEFLVTVLFPFLHFCKVLSILCVALCLWVNNAPSCVYGYIMLHPVLVLTMRVLHREFVLRLFDGGQLEVVDLNFDGHCPTVDEGTPSYMYDYMKYQFRFAPVLVQAHVAL